MRYNLSGIQPTSEMAYPNAEAHAELKAMMNRYNETQKSTHKPKMQFWVDKYGYDCIFVESGTVSSFKYRINSKSFDWVMNYLTKGTVEDFGIEPLALEKSEYSDYNTIQTELLKMFVDNGLGRIQFTPEHRDRLGKLSAIASFKYGIVSFRVDRTDELCDYLREKGLIR